MRLLTSPTRTVIVKLLEPPDERLPMRNVLFPLTLVPVVALNVTNDGYKSVRLMFVALDVPLFVMVMVYISTDPSGTGSWESVLVSVMFALPVDDEYDENPVTLNA